MARWGKIARCWGRMKRYLYSYFLFPLFPCYSADLHYPSITPRERRETRKDEPVHNPVSNDTSLGKASCQCKHEVGPQKTRRGIDGKP